MVPEPLYEKRQLIPVSQQLLIIPKNHGIVSIISITSVKEPGQVHRGTSSDVVADNQAQAVHPIWGVDKV
jgi:hypothetical protein